ncbi:hypothetical protein [Flavobacterium johnsoniae]|jgi:hypothetical protein|uniref:Uncharacterized protein n=1 Tax=Flavobacterium johnsoniae (strain ATCC 17061 / DSM 2064 / JCM 8514 / BCRC 14874 / CCUG 350202 / NBRC 14942 / NCIMB 11054 / UW101) TaxID=376686 RepID=A5FDF2_FLAJ1|nr:hypothetical protein [Flavobacterium johnsoniae]ABQ06774.1 hypothetical protein Fjoh_3763 [Flavobacterium johnsoniae UW101]OXE97361.1 hypothetical protein B0A63_19040 [Flavobacterium johnsoniae UW101]WQG81394.1 hypothetical protein SR927_25685 [Flavobacterium johnsoniae UW101]SHL41000.1 hypothetical protein SAMN05444146_3760 [Flavobacterium johnsoniae]
MLTENDAAQVFDTILSIPGMNEPVRIDLKISRKNVLLLHHVIERGLLENNSSPSMLLRRTAQENIQEIKQLSADCLARAGLTELHEKLAGLGTEKNSKS